MKSTHIGTHLRKFVRGQKLLVGDKAGLKVGDKV